MGVPGQGFSCITQKDLTLTLKVEQLTLEVERQGCHNESSCDMRFGKRKLHPSNTWSSFYLKFVLLVRFFR